MKKNLPILVFQRISLIIGILTFIVFFVPMMGGIMPYIVMSGSMEPEIQTGSVVYINSHVKSDEIQVGDIIGFNTKEGQVTHRVVEINSDGSFVTKGDNNEEKDGQPVSADKMKGKTIFSIPYIGRIAAFVKSKQGISVVAVYVLLNVLCIIFDKKIYDIEEPSSFKEAIMRCENLDEIKKVIIEEMDSFKEQLLEDVSSADLKQLEAPKQKLLSVGEIFDSDIESRNIEKIENLNLESAFFENESDKVESIERDFGIDIKEEIRESEELENLLNEIDGVDEEDIDLDKVKQELVRYDNPKLRELRNNLKEQVENSKIVEYDFSKKDKSQNMDDVAVEKNISIENPKKANNIKKSKKKNRNKNRKKNRKVS